jgi:acyl carrier protein
MSEQVEQRVRSVIADALNLDFAPSRDTRFNEDLEADSMDVVSIIIATEEEFGIEFHEDDVDRLRTVGDMIDYIETRVA